MLRKAFSSTVLGNRNFLFLYLGGVISASGATIASLTIVWLIYTETKSALAITYLGIASIAPTIALGLLIGAVVDRFDRRKLMILSDLVRAAAVAAVALYITTIGFDLRVLLAIVVLISTFATIFRPATNALLPTIVQAESVQDANGLITASNSITQMLANAVGGILIVLAGIVLGLLYNSLTHLASAVMLFLIVVPHQAQAARDYRRSVPSDIKEGLRFMLRNKAILQTTLAATVLNFFGTMIMPFMVVYVNVHLGADASFYGIMVAALSFGLAAGSVLVGRLNTVHFAGKIFILSSFGFGLATLGFVFLRSTHAAVVLAGLIGILLGLINTTFFSVMQLVVPNEVLGRVLSVDEVGSYAAIPLGQIAAGVLIESLGIVNTYSVAGLGVLTAALTMLILKDLRGFRYIPPVSPEAA